MCASFLQLSSAEYGGPKVTKCCKQYSRNIEVPSKDLWEQTQLDHYLNSQDPDLLHTLINLAFNQTWSLTVEGRKHLLLNMRFTFTWNWVISGEFTILPRRFLPHYSSLVFIWKKHNDLSLTFSFHQNDSTARGCSWWCRIMRGRWLWPQTFVFVEYSVYSVTCWVTQLKTLQRRLTEGSYLLTRLLNPSQLLLTHFIRVSKPLFFCSFHSIVLVLSFLFLLAGSSSHTEEQQLSTWHPVTKCFFLLPGDWAHAVIVCVWPCTCAHA